MRVSWNRILKKYPEHYYTKNSSIYWTILIIWIFLEIFGIIPLINQIIFDGSTQHYFASLLLALNAIFISYFWLNGIKDLVYVPVFYYQQKHRVKRELSIENCKPYLVDNPRVVLCYTTCDDFIPDSLRKSMQQSYPNCHVVILDDSRKDTYKVQIDNFSKIYKIPVIRRKHHLFYKAGNLNHYLMHHNDWDYFVPLDSDEIIPYDFVERALPFFYWDKKLGILQCNHISTRNYNKFMKEYSRGASAHWPVYQSVKERYGFLSMLGHGAMISRKCLDSIHGFPHMVAEDISATLEATLKGWHTRFARTITCQEQFPLDYLGFRKRLDKWCSGNIQFTNKYTKIIFLTHRLTWYQKLDILLFVYGLPLNYIFSVFLLINIVLMPIYNVSPYYSLWLLIPTLIFFFAPMVNDMIYNSEHDMGFIQQICYSWDSILLYGGMYFPTIYTAIRLKFGEKPKFTVTPKKETHYSIIDAFKFNIAVLIFALVLSLVSLYFCYSMSPIILIIVPAICSVSLTLMSNKKE